jgi:predicted Zn-dependent protease
MPKVWAVRGRPATPRGRHAACSHTGMGIRLVTLVLLASCIAGGCAVATPRAIPSSPQARVWIAARGGLVHDAAGTTELRRIVVELLGEDAAARVVVSILDSNEPGAYAWPRRHVFVTRGLMHSVTREELAAAIAHELGHLIDDGHVAAPAALSGGNTDSDADAEARADAIGIALLRRAGHDPDAMTRLLRHMSHQPNLCPHTRSHIDRRADALGVTAARP